MNLLNLPIGIECDSFQFNKLESSSLKVALFCWNRADVFGVEVMWKCEKFTDVLYKILVFKWKWSENIFLIVAAVTAKRHVEYTT